MTIDQAVKVLSAAQKGTWAIPHADRYDALKLGIEALKRVNASRPLPIPRTWELLPGETQE